MNIFYYIIFFILNTQILCKYSFYHSSYIISTDDILPFEQNPYKYPIKYNYVVFVDNYTLEAEFYMKNFDYFYQNKKIIIPGKWLPLDSNDKDDIIIIMKDYIYSELMLSLFRKDGYDFIYNLFPDAKIREIDLTLLVFNCMVLLFLMMIHFLMYNRYKKQFQKNIILTYFIYLFLIGVFLCISIFTYYMGFKIEWNYESYSENILTLYIFVIFFLYFQLIKFENLFYLLSGYGTLFFNLNEVDKRKRKNNKIRLFYYINFVLSLIYIISIVIFGNYKKLYSHHFFCINLIVMSTLFLYSGLYLYKKLIFKLDLFIQFYKKYDYENFFKNRIEAIEYKIIIIKQFNIYIVLFGFLYLLIDVLLEIFPKLLYSFFLLDIFIFTISQTLSLRILINVKDNLPEDYLKSFLFFEEVINLNNKRGTFKLLINKEELKFIQLQQIKLNEKNKLPVCFFKPFYDNSKEKTYPKICENLLIGIIRYDE